MKGVFGSQQIDQRKVLDLQQQVSCDQFDETRNAVVDDGWLEVKQQFQRDGPRASQAASCRLDKFWCPVAVDVNWQSAFCDIPFGGTGMLLVVTGNGKPGCGYFFEDPFGGVQEYGQIAGDFLLARARQESYQLPPLLLLPREKATV